MLRRWVRTSSRRFQRPSGLPSLGFGPLRGPSTPGLLPRRMLRARSAPASQRSDFVHRSPPRPTFRSARRSVPPPLLRRSQSNLSVGDPPVGHGGEGFVAPSAVKQATDRDEAGSSWYRYRLNEHRRVLPPSVPGSSDASVFRRLLLGSCEDPPVTPCGASARLPSGPVPLREQDDQMASSHLHFRLGDLKEYEDGTVGLDPSRACVRPSLFTMFDHGWPSLPMTRP